MARVLDRPRNRAFHENAAAHDACEPGRRPYFARWRSGLLRRSAHAHRQGRLTHALQTLIDQLRPEPLSGNALPEGGPDLGVRSRFAAGKTIHPGDGFLTLPGVQNGHFGWIWGGFGPFHLRGGIGHERQVVSEMIHGCVGVRNVM